MIKSKITRENLYLVAWSVLLIGLFVSCSKWTIYPVVKSISRIVQILAVILCLGKIVLDLYTEVKTSKNLRDFLKKIDYKILVVVLLLAISFFFSINKGILFLTVFLLGAEKKYISKVYKISIFIYLMMLVGIILSYKFSLIPQADVYRDHNIRYSLGTVSPNFLMMCFFVITYLYLIINRGKLKVYELIGLILVNALLYFITDSRAGFFLALLLIVIYLFTGKGKEEKKEEIGKEHKFLKIVAILIPIIFSVISIGIPVLSKYNDLSELNGLLSDRVRLSREAIDNYGITSLGTRIRWIGQKSAEEKSNTEDQYNYVDSSYLKILINNGVIIFVICLIGLIRLNYRTVKENNILLFVLLLIIELYGLIDSWMFDINSNVVLFLLCDDMTLIKNKNK